MREVAANVGHRSLEVLSKLVASRWRKSRAAWLSAWHEPALGLRLLYLVVGLFVGYLLVPYSFRELGVMGGISYPHRRIRCGLKCNVLQDRESRDGPITFPLD